MVHLQVIFKIHPPSPVWMALFHSKPVKYVCIVTSKLALVIIKQAGTLEVRVLIIKHGVNQKYWQLTFSYKWYFMSVKVTFPQFTYLCAWPRTTMNIIHCSACSKYTNCMIDKNYQTLGDSYISICAEPIGFCWTNFSYCLMLV